MLLAALEKLPPIPTFRNQFVTVIITLIALVLVGSITPWEIIADQTLSDEVSTALRNRLEATEALPGILVGEEQLTASVMFAAFYKKRSYLPAWSGEGGPLPQADALLRALKNADQEGLRPSDYHLAQAEAALRQLRQTSGGQGKQDPTPWADFDLLLTDAFLIYGSHLRFGRFKADTADQEWLLTHSEADLGQVLQNALDANQIEPALESLLPPQPDYARLRNALAQYREIASHGGWPLVPDGPKLRKGDRTERIRVLRNRLVIEGYLDQVATTDALDFFDDALAGAVRRFQARQGLGVDGVVGPETLMALNIPVETRIIQIALNLERWRWLPHELGERYILVNIANFELEIVGKGQTRTTMRIVVGKPYLHTPIFSAHMTSLVLNPYWEIPPSIAAQEILPMIRKDPHYLVKEGIKIFRGWSAQEREIDPKAIRWEKLNAKNFSYRLRQDPGPPNPLGQIKFSLPNRFHVYLHDTPARSMFARKLRGFSHGCIRVEKPIELAEYVLQGDPKWSKDTILEVLGQGLTKTIRLREPVAVHVVYRTAWPSDDGSMHFRNDIYGRDQALDQNLCEEPPS